MRETLQSRVEIGRRINSDKASLKDRGCRRHLSWAMEFDTRSTILKIEIDDRWEQETKVLWRSNKEKVIKELSEEFGESGIETKVENFIALDTKPISILSFHNRFFDQVRRAYVIGAYYPALVGACALGERILNHLMLDLREFFTSSQEYAKVYRKKSFDDWDVPINTLSAWNVLSASVADEFRLLKVLRNRSIHFNVQTYETLKEDSLAAILHIRKIIETQFGSFGPLPWFISGTQGHAFIAREWETSPFIQTYFLCNCPFLGPYFSMDIGEGGWEFYDFSDYGDGDISDEEFASKYNERTQDMLARKPQQ